MLLKDILTPAMKPAKPCDERPLWKRRLSADSTFCRAVVAAGYLTREQMLRAALRYRLGCSRDGGVIFWQIDQMGHIWDGKIMYYRPDCHRDHDRHPNWVSHLLKVHYGCQHLDIPTAHCLFGLHLLNIQHSTFNIKHSTLNIKHSTFRSTEGRLQGKNFQRSARPKVACKARTFNTERTIAVVESEKTAVIMSELFPDSLWLATGGLRELSPVKLLPLRHYRVVLFPDTDEHHQAYSLWYETAQKARRDYGVHCFVSPLLERRATPEQKRRKIDLVDFLLVKGEG